LSDLHYYRGPCQHGPLGPHTKRAVVLREPALYHRRTLGGSCISAIFSHTAADLSLTTCRRPHHKPALVSKRPHARMASCDDFNAFQRLDHLSAEAREVRQPLLPLHNEIASAVDFVESRSISDNHLRNDLTPVGDPCVDSILTGMATLRFWPVAWPPQASKAPRTVCISWLQPSTR
jgi:hypothetical protein